MSQLAKCLSGARACLQINIRVVARALGVSDRIITHLEQNAVDPEDPRVEQLITYYEDLGLEFLTENEKIVGVKLLDVEPLKLRIQRHPAPDQLIDELLKRMRYIRGVAYDLKTLDKTKASRYDTVELNVPVPVRRFVHQILHDWVSQILRDWDWVSEKSPLLLSLSDKPAVEVNMDNIDSILGRI